MSKISGGGKQEKKDFGAQPLDDVIVRLGLSNSGLVQASTEQLTHKMVQKGRKGRRITRNAKLKILHALQASNPEEKFILKLLFNY